MGSLQNLKPIAVRFDCPAVRFPPKSEIPPLEIDLIPVASDGFAKFGGLSSESDQMADQSTLNDCL
jgi:hypothetical protein